MNYSDFAAKLTELGGRLGKHAAKLEGEALGRSGHRLYRALEHFEEALDSWLASRKSGELTLETVLHSPAARRHLNVDILRKTLREVAGKRLKSEDLAAAKREFVALVHEQERAEKAAKELKRYFAQAAHVASGGKDKRALQQEFLRLGRLADDEFEKEIGHRTFGDLRRLAAANGIRFSDKTTKPRLILSIRRYSLRAALNIAVTV